MTLTLKTPQPLCVGDKIGIAAPARKISPEELQFALDIFKSWGLEPVFASNLFLSDHQYAGTDEERITGFQELLDNPDIKAIICARGGYGTLRIIDNFDFSFFAAKPKWIAGYSDVTILHSHINNLYATETLHCSMPLSFLANTSEALESLRKALFGEPITYSVSGHEFDKTGETSGILTGGNLSILYALSDSVSDIDTKGKILFIEDLEEYLYHIDRMMMQLKRSGKLQNLAGLIVGGMSNMNDNTVPFGKSAYEIIAEHVTPYSYPVCFGFPAGHIEDNRALIFGREVKLVVSDTGSELCFE
ncbi:MAG: LD-carboxypeptidase [Bacteroidales bacterium]|jgi:muramoyltetrapeptide carboxypeptidase|nr:LD-carboxypeptidase [Bacteroidales bacterium]MDD4214988.1 LD-carboxypeptidase [Bacteroidales bacterium]